MRKGGAKKQPTSKTKARRAAAPKKKAAPARRDSPQQQRREKRSPSDDRHLVIPDGNEYPLLLNVVNMSKNGLLVHAATPIDVGHRVIVVARYRRRFSIRNIRKQEPLAVYAVRWCAEMETFGFFWGMERVRS